MNPEEYSRIIAAGGDGTINICVNSMIKHDIHLPLALCLPERQMILLITLNFLPI